MKTKKQRIKDNCIIMIAISLLLISIGLKTGYVFGKESNFKLDYEYINVKDVAQVKVANKDNSANNLNGILTSALASVKTSNSLLNLSNSDVNTDNLVLEEVALESIIPVVEEAPKQIWRLPTEFGVITQNPHWGHAALDIISPRGSSEYIFPVANGIVSGVYVDPAGALVVTVLHNIDGVNYTSQYAHLSSFAEGLYVGKEVTVNDVLGRMGTTGYSTGVHLHLAVVDCALFDPNDNNCHDLNSFFHYANSRVSEGYLGLGSQMYVPGSWDSR